MLAAQAAPRIIAQGARVSATKPLPAQIGDYIDATRMSSLKPYRRITLTQQSADTTKVQGYQTGASTSGDGMDYPIIVPYVSTQVKDSLGSPYPGGPQPGDDMHVVELTPGNPVILGQRVKTPPPSPFVSAIGAGNGIVSTPYGDATVMAPSLSVKPGNGVAVDATGVKVNPATNGGINVAAGGVSVQGGNGISVGASGVTVQPASGGVVSVSASGVDVNVGTGIQKVSGALAVNLTAGTGISVSGATISTNLVSGTGISISGSTISVNLSAGTGISISGATISLNLIAGTGISLVGNVISVSLVAGTGISISGSTISVSLFGGTGISVSGNTISVSLVGSSPISVSGATISLSYGSHLTVSGASLDVNLGSGFVWSGTHQFNNMPILAGPSYAFQVSSAYSLGSGFPPSWATGYFVAYINSTAVKVYFQ